MMRICLFLGTHHPTRHKLLKKILEKQNVEVIECCERVSGIGSLILSYFKMFFLHLKLDYDFMLVPWWGIFTFPLAKILSKKPIIYKASLSHYSAMTNERRTMKSNSLYAKFIHFIENYALKHSALILTETQVQAEYFINEYKIDKEKFRISVPSADETQFRPLPFKEPSDIFSVLYFGRFAYLHGTQIIIEAAKILSLHNDIVFNFRE